MDKQPYNHYSDEFKKSVLDYYLTHSGTETAKKFNVHKMTIYEWDHIKERSQHRRKYFQQTSKIRVIKSLEWKHLNKLKQNHYSVAYKARNPEKYKIWKARARMVRREKFLSDNKLNDRQFNNIFARFGNKCAICGSDNNLTLDHWHPLSMGNLLSETNAVIMCKSCNCKKSYKMPHEIYDNETVSRIEKLLYS